jgi:hypothetical protein
MADEKPTAVLALSDDDFAKLNEPDAPAAPTAEAEPAKTEEELAAETEAATAAAAETNAGDAGDDDGEELTDAERAAQASDGEDDGAEGDDPAGSGEAKASEGDGDGEGEKKPETEAKPEGEAKPGEKKPEGEGDAATQVEAKPVDLQGFYDQVMKPFKANGKTIELKSPEEAIQLMQMGANYTRKLQAIQPQRKLLLLLEKNGLLDEGKLSFLIDLDRKDPAAIKQLVKDSGIDPIDIDVSEDTAYRPGNHQVSDEEVNFRDVMGELSSNPAGKETIAEIHDTWDQTSKEALWGDPQVLKVIHEQRESGVYALITAEMDRQITLGQIPANTPFLEAYKKAGDDLVAATVVKQPEGSGAGEAAPTGEKSPIVVATRAAKPKSDLANDDKAKAASGTRSSPKAAKTIVNPLAESDEAFMKQMEGRL